MKLGEIVVHIDNYNFFKFHQNQMKNNLGKLYHLQTKIYGFFEKKFQIEQLSSKVVILVKKTFLNVDFSL